ALDDEDLRQLVHARPPWRVLGAYRFAGRLRYVRDHAAGGPDQLARRGLRPARSGCGRRLAARVSLPDPAGAEVPADADDRQPVAPGLPGRALRAARAPGHVLGVRP